MIRERGLDWSSPSGREERIAEIVAQCSDRVNAGELLDVSAVTAEHPELAPHLELALDALLELATTRDDADFRGRRLGEFHLLREIGRGGMGVVYEARQESLDRHVALKVLPSALLARDSAVKRFVREARVAARLQHPNVVSTFGMGIESDTPYFAMEYVDGETVEEVLARVRSAADGAARSPADESIPSRPTLLDTDEIRLDYCIEVADLFAGAADGLQHAHAQGIVHRDLKPSNLILDGDGRLRVLDFGLASLEGQDTLTGSGDLIGTPLYMSPEQAGRQQITVGPPSDIYSFGATLYEVLTWRAPFRGADFHDTLQQIQNREPEGLRRWQPRIPVDLEVIVLKCLRKDPRDRYLTAEALAQDLRRFARGDAIEARPQSVVERLTRRVRRHARQWIVAAVILALVGTVATLTLSNRRQDRLRRTAEYGPLVAGAAMEMQLVQNSTVGQADRGIDREMEAFFGGMSRAADFIGVDQEDLARSAIDELTRACELVSDRPEAFFHRARALLLLGRDDDAARDLDRAEACDENFVPALLLRASMLETAGDVAAAESLRDEAESRAETDWALAWVRAQRAMLAVDWRAAEREFGELARMELAGDVPYLGFGVESRLGRGLARLNLGDHDGAIDDFLYARAMWQNAAAPGLLLARAYVLSGELGRAERVLERVYEGATHADDVAYWAAVIYSEKGHDERALPWVRRLSDPRRQAQGAAYVLISLERYDEAIAECEAAIESGSSGAIPWMLKGYAIYRRDRFTNPAGLPLAYEMELKAVEVEPDNIMARVGLGVALVEKNELDEAIRLLRSTLDLGAKNGFVHFYLGKALELNGDLDDAAEQYETAVHLVPDHADAMARLAGIHRARGNRDEAVELVRRAAEFEPRNLTVLMMRATLESDAGRHDRAVEFLQELVTRSPYNQDMRAMLARELTSAGRHGRAIEEYSQLIRALDLDPRLEAGRKAAAGARYRAAIAEIHVAGGDVAQAVRFYQKAIRGAGDSPDLHARLGRLLASENRDEEAAAALRRALELRPDQPAVAATLEVVEARLREAAAGASRSGSDFESGDDRNP